MVETVKKAEGQLSYGWVEESRIGMENLRQAGFPQS
jgi:hypothetical protein